MTVSLAEAKAHCVVEHNLDDAYLTGLIQAATTATEDYTKTVITQRTLVKKFDDFSELRLKSPLRSVTSITYVDDDGATQTLSASIYQPVGVWSETNQSKVSEIVLGYDQDWPSIRLQKEAVTVTYVAGYATDEIPDNLRHAILLFVGNLYANREPLVIGTIANKLELNYQWLLSPFRVFNV